MKRVPARRRWLGCGALALGGWAVAAQAQTCVQARVADETAYACLNDSLARVAQAAHGAPPPGVLAAGSPAPAVGTFSYAATSERMGSAFGHSVQAQRPALPWFGAAVARPGR